jgi:hypothetical protein
MTTLNTALSSLDAARQNAVQAVSQMHALILDCRKRRLKALEERAQKARATVPPDEAHARLKAWPQRLASEGLFAQAAAGFLSQTEAEPFLNREEFIATDLRLAFA